MRILAQCVKDHIGEKIELKGWIHRIRELGKINFLILRDRSGTVQLIVKEKPNFTHESVISVVGTVNKNEKAPGGVEVQVDFINVIAKAEPDLPIPVNQNPEKLSIDAILDNRIISLRNPKIRKIFILQAGILQYFGEIMRKQGFTEIKTSKLIGSGTEGGTGLFAVNYFDTKVYLAQSPQFYKQAMVASGMESVFEIGMAYRAEKHDTPRHLNEYVSLDVETAFIESEEDLMDLEQKILKYIFSKVQENHSDILDEWETTVPKADDVDKIPRISHDQAKKIISEKIGRRVFEINPEGERVLCEWADETAGIKAIFVNSFPRKKRPFYTYPSGQKTMSFDLLFRGLEITTGGRRINEYKMLLENIPKFGLNEEELFDYIQIFKYGCPPHGGFAIGLERLTQQILGLSNVKEAALFPRDRKRIRP